MIVAIDLETSSLDPATGYITAVGLQWGDNDRAIIDGDDIARFWPLFIRKLEDGTITEVIAI